MYVLSIVLYLFSLNTFATSESIIEDRWRGALFIQANKNFKQDILVKEPRGTRQHILSVTYLDKGFNKVKDCLVYDVPKKREASTLSIITVISKESCVDNLFSKVSFKWDQIFNFTYSINDTKLELKMDDIVKIFNLYNLTLRSKGMLISFVDSDDGEVLKSGDICFDVSDKCNVLMPDQCILCPGGIQPAIASSCQSKTRKYCSDKVCGTRGELACVRGFVASGYQGDYCLNDSPIGYCSGRLRVVCIDGVLRCR